ncbi:MAG: 6-phospho-beta-glucosidase [Chloroflexota bacterium]
MGLKIVVIGGGSTYTPELVEGFANRTATLPIDELVLHDIDPDRLDVVGGLARRILGRLGWPGRLVTTTDRDAALDGAAFVLVQLRIGGQAARHLDETLPLDFGAIGQETTGAGGFAKALRTVPVVLSLADDVGRRALPDAWIVDFTNPVGIVTQALIDAGHRAVGLCNVAIGFQRRFARRFGVTPAQVELEHVGLNHLTWIRAVRVDGVDRLPELLAAADDEALIDFLPGDVLRTLGAIPSYYLRYYYATDEVLAEQRAGHTRARDVIEIEQELLALYRDPSLDRKPELLEQRGGAFYSEAAAALIESLHTDAGDVQIVDVRNDGALPDLAYSDVVEIPARIRRDGPQPLSLAPLAPEMRGLAQHLKAYERLTIDAAATGDRETAFRALLANPLVPGYRAASGLLDRILAANVDHLPAFAGSRSQGSLSATTRRES